MEYTDGTLKYNVINLANKSGEVIHGTITAFSGTFDSNGYPIDKSTGAADTTWHLCDGTNGTPDLRGRFILGASDAHAVGSTGGEKAHQLTEQELPKVTVTSTGTTTPSGLHKHNAIVHTGGRNGASLDSEYSGSSTERYPTDEAGQHVHNVTVSGTFGGGQSHSIMPPFYTLSYIMKL